MESHHHHHSHPYKAIGQSATHVGIGVGTPQRQKRKQGEQSTWFWFSWRLYNGETSASSWGAQGIQSERVTAGECAPLSLSQRETVCKREREFEHFLIRPESDLNLHQTINNSSYFYAQYICIHHKTMYCVSRIYLCKYLISRKSPTTAWRGVKVVFPSAHRRKQTVRLWI